MYKKSLIILFTVIIFFSTCVINHSEVLTRDAEVLNATVDMQNNLKIQLRVNNKVKRAAEIAKPVAIWFDVPPQVGDKALAMILVASIGTSKNKTRITITFDNVTNNLLSLSINTVK